MRSRRSLLPLLLASTLLAACRTGRNYADPALPRYAGAVPDTAVARPTGDPLRVVSFNVAFSREVDGAIAVLAGEPSLRGADVVLLQEMTADAARRIAAALGMGHVYYPAIYHTRARRDFGNAVLSRWPIVADAKLPLPHRSRYARTQRIATAATIRVGRDSVRVYSTHLGTLADVGAGARRDQLRRILDDARPFAHVVIGGDLNDGSVGRVALDAGYAWPTAEGPRTTRFGRWDHIFVRGLAVPATDGAGTVRDVHGASDHVPVWARARLVP